MLDKRDPGLDTERLPDPRAADERVPIDLGFVLRDIPGAAAGIAAVVHSFKHSLHQTGAVNTAHTFRAINQRDGFDCPSCAWADPEEKRSLTEFCENGAKAMADAATQKIVPAEFFAQYSVADLSRESDMWLNARGRLTEPMVLLPGATHYTPISWDEAFELVARELNMLDHPDRAAFYTSGKTSNEAAFMYQLFVRMFGTNNLPDCSNLCHESSGAAIRESLGVGKATVTLSDLEHAKCILLVGQNPGTNHPRMMTSLQVAKKNGATVIAINPIPEVGLLRFRHPQDAVAILGKGTKIADHFVQVRINGDAALFKGILKSLFAREAAAPGTVFDADFIRNHTSGFSELAEDVARAQWTQLETQSGISRAQIEEVAGVIAAAPSIVACWAMGITQQPNSVATICELINILLVGGNVGRPNAGVLPVRGHSNVQGDRTMGVWKRMDDAFLDRLGKEFAFTPPHEHGYDVVQTIEAMLDGRVSVFMSLGGNFLSATPDTDRVARGLRNTSLSVCVSTKLNRGHLVTGNTALILPCITRTEIDAQHSGDQFVTVENTISVVSRSRGRMTPPASTLKSEPSIVAGIAAATLRGRRDLDWNALVADYDVVRDHISHVVPGFADFNARIRLDDIFYAPVAAKKRIFNTSTSKARFTLNALPTAGVDPGQYVMMTLRTHDQFNTVIYGPDDRYRGVMGGRRIIFMNAADIAEAGLAARQLVDISSHFAGETRTVTQFAVVPYDIPRGSTATYYPETNPLVPLYSTAAVSNTPTSKFVVISLRPSQAA